MTRYSSHMRVAHEKGMLLGEYLERVTHLEHQMWVIWLNRQWNQPTRDNWYTMALTAEVRQFRYGFAYKHPPTVEPKHAMLKFPVADDGGVGDERPGPEQPETAGGELQP